MNNQAAPRAMPSPANRFFFKQQLILFGLVVGVRLLSLYVIPAETGQNVKIKSLKLPDTLAGWKGRNVKVDPFVYEVLHPDAVVQKRFGLAGDTSRSSEVEVLVMYTRNAEGFHPPDVCMKAQGWVISKTEQRQVSAGGKSLWLEVVTGEQREQRKLLAYSFSDATGAVSGRTATFANMVMSRFMRKRVGALEIQFAYGARSLTPDGDFNPQFKTLMLQTADTIYAQLKAQIEASSPNDAPLTATSITASNRISKANLSSSQPIIASS